MLSGIIRRHQMRFSATAELELSYLEVPWENLQSPHGEVRGSGTTNWHAVKRNDQVIDVFGASFIDVCARFAARHRCDRHFGDLSDGVCAGELADVVGGLEPGRDVAGTVERCEPTVSDRRARPRCR